MPVRASARAESCAPAPCALRHAARVELQHAAERGWRPARAARAARAYARDGAGGRCAPHARQQRLRCEECSKKVVWLRCRGRDGRVQCDLERRPEIDGLEVLFDVIFTHGHGSCPCACARKALRWHGAQRMRQGAWTAQESRCNEADRRGAQRIRMMRRAGRRWTGRARAQRAYPANMRAAAGRVNAAFLGRYNSPPVGPPPPFSERLTRCRL